MNYNIDLYKDYKFLTDYFTSGVQNGNLAHCFLFWGNDIDTQYNLAIEIARLLNCKNDKSIDCKCLNCTWARQNKHPAILTYSKFDSKPSDDKSKTVISIEQARDIKQILSVTSDYHRVFIFCDKESPLQDSKILGLNQTNFSTDAVNALLKTFEEPPQNTTFFFLTKDLSDMIQTVISRSQCFFVPSKKDEPQNFELVKDFMDKYVESDRNKVLDFRDEILQLSKDNELNDIFTQMQNYILILLKSNLNNKSSAMKYLKDLSYIEQSKKELAVDMNDAIVVENLVYNLILH